MSGIGRNRQTNCNPYQMISIQTKKTIRIITDKN